MGRDALCNVNTSVLVRCGACVHTEFMNAVTNAVKVQNTHPNAHAHTPLLASQHRHSAWLPPEFVTATVRVSQSARLARLCLNQCFPIRGITAVGMPSRSRNVAHFVFCLFSPDGRFIHLCQLSLNHRGVFPPTGKPLRNNGVLSKTARRWGVVTHELFLGGLDVCYCWRNVKNVQVIGITRGCLVHQLLYWVPQPHIRCAVKTKQSGTRLWQELCSWAAHLRFCKMMQFIY